MQLVVPAGATVTWTNHDEAPHVVTDDHYSAVFTRPGTYAYYCSIHPQMTATIVVK